MRAVAGRQHLRRARPDRRPRRRVGLRQVLARPRRRRARAAPTAGEVLFEGQRAARRSRRAARPPRDARMQMVFQNPFASLNPRRTIGAQIADGARTRRRAERLAPRARGGSCSSEVGIAGRRGRPLPAPVLRRPAPAHRDRARARRRPVRASSSTSRSRRSTPPRRRRSRTCSCGSRATCELGLLLISHDLAIVRHVADAISVMYLGLIVEIGADARRLGDAAAPVHRGADRGDPARRRRGRPAGGAARRGARSGAAAERLPLPSALPVRLRPLLGGGAAALRARRRARLRPASCATPTPTERRPDMNDAHLPETEYAARRERLAERMQEQGIDALFVPPSSDLEYLTGLERDLPSFGQSTLRARLGDGRVHRPRPRAAVRAAAHVRRVPPLGQRAGRPDHRQRDRRRPRALPQGDERARRACRRLGIGARTWGETVLELQAALPGARARERHAARQRAAARQVAARARADDRRRAHRATRR